MSNRPILGLIYSAIVSTAAGCTSVPPAPTVPPAAGDELIIIRNEPGPFCGRCDSVKVVALSDGRVWVEHGYWAGKYRNWRVERRLEQASPQSFARFREHLIPFRPHGQLVLDDKPPCETFWHDVDGVRVEWRDSNGADTLIFNFGCDPKTKQAMAAALKAAPDLLGIDSLKIPWGQWVVTSSG